MSVPARAILEGDAAMKIEGVLEETDALAIWVS